MLMTINLCPCHWTYILTLIMSAVTVCCYQATTPTPTPSVQVHINISTTAVDTPGGTDQTAPDGFNVGLSLGPELDINLQLKRVGHISHRIPVYSLTADVTGELLIERQEVRSNQNVAYYQDVNHGAVLQIAKVYSTLGTDNIFVIQKGEFRANNTRFLITPLEKKEKREARDEFQHHLHMYIIQRAVNQDTEWTDAVVAPPISMKTIREDDTVTFGLQNVSSQKRRQKRQVMTNYFIDVTAYLDYSRYQRFQQQSDNDTINLLSRIQEYYAFVFAGIDLIYQGWPPISFNLKVRLTKIVILKDPEMIPLNQINESIYQNVNVSLNGSIDTYSIIRDFWNLLNSSEGRELSFPYDHAMLFVGSDLWNLYPTPNNGLTGLAAVGTLCRTDGMSSSVVEDLGDYFATYTGAHELAHCLGSLHDGMTPQCKADDFYLMAPFFSWRDESKKLHPWQFSNCSVAEITASLESLMNTSSGDMCLSDALPAIGQFPDVSDRLLGQLYPPNQQCTLRYGQWSFDCRLGNAFDICTSLWCYSPSDDLCYSLPPLTGTSCGSGKVCRLGRCVTDTHAPEVDDLCMFEDSMMVFRKSCQEGISEFKGHCYNERVVKRCCLACGHVRANNSECPFGDAWLNCTSDVCVNGSMDDMSRCCHTCENVTAQSLRSTSSLPATAQSATGSGANRFDTTKTNDVPNPVDDRDDTEVSRSTKVRAVCPPAIFGLVQLIILTK